MILVPKPMVLAQNYVAAAAAGFADFYFIKNKQNMYGLPKSTLYIVDTQHPELQEIVQLALANQHKVCYHSRPTRPDKNASPMPLSDLIAVCKMLGDNLPFPMRQMPVFLEDTGLAYITMGANSSGPFIRVSSRPPREGEKNLVTFWRGQTIKGLIPEEKS